MKKIILLLLATLMFTGCLLDPDTAEALNYRQAEILYKQVVGNNHALVGQMIRVKDVTPYTNARWVSFAYETGSGQWRSYGATLYTVDQKPIIALKTTYSSVGGIVHGSSTAASGPVSLTRQYPVTITSDSLFVIAGQVLIETSDYLPVTIYNPNDFAITVTVGGVDHTISAHNDLDITEE